MNSRWERLIGIMDQQKQLLDDFAEASDCLRQGLHSRDWAALETSFKSLDSMAVRMESVERKRQALTEKLCNGQGLEDAVSELSPEIRSRFLEVRSELKARIVTVRSRTRGLASYADSRARLGRELMEELVPSTRGRIYDKRGRSSAAGRDPLVVSRHL